MIQNRGLKSAGWLTFFLLVLVHAFAMETAAVSMNRQQTTLVVQPGDHWHTLAWRFGHPEHEIRLLNGYENRYYQPPIGARIDIPTETLDQAGLLTTLRGTSLIQTAVRHNLSLFKLAESNQIQNPYAIIFGPIFVPQQEGVPRQLPDHFTHLELSHVPAQPGTAVGWRGGVNQEINVQSWLDGRLLAVVQNREKMEVGFIPTVGLTGTGAFLGDRELSLEIEVEGEGRWIQPWRFVDRTDWTFQQLTLTGEAALIDQAAIDAERTRLLDIWHLVTGVPQWQLPFQTPVDSFLEISSLFGARRSYNGGPYRTYHEGVDYAAFQGTPVLAPAGGTVVLAEQLYVRGGAVILDHGLGIFTGYYHLSSINVLAGEEVIPDQILGEVGTTGLSTGNHLHWDLLVNGVWVDPLSWQMDGMANWILNGFYGTSSH